MSRIVERRGRGFTLIELVIAIAIMSVVLAALYSSFLLADRALVQVVNRRSSFRSPRICRHAEERARIHPVFPG